MAASDILAPVDEATLQRVGSALRRMGEDPVSLSAAGSEPSP
jgi:hypothetical protein